jgi:hypothetical protein
VHFLALTAMACSSSSSGGTPGGPGPDGSLGTGGGAAEAGAGGKGTGGRGSSTGGATSDAGATPLGANPCATRTNPGPLTPTYFVDFAAGSDAADGRSQSTAWKHAPGDANATGGPSSVKLAPGDVVLFKGGVAYQGSIQIAASGTAAASLVYDGNGRGTWGTGHALIDGQEQRSSGISMNGRSYVLVDSFDLAHFDKTQSSTAVAIQGGSHDEVRNCHISDVYYPTNPGGTSWEKQSGNGISVNNSPFTDVNHNFVRDVGNAGISFTAGSGLVVDGGRVACNEVTNMNWGIAVALGNSTPGTKITGVSIVGNYIHDFDQYYVSSVWHRDGLFVFSRPDTDQTSIENLEIGYNYFEDNTSAVGSTAWIYVEYVCKGFNIHHNVLNTSRSYYAIRILGDGFQVAGNHVIANNVIDNANGIGDGMHIQESTGITLRNNIFYDDGHAYIVATSSMAGFSADYDLMYRVGGRGNVVSLNAGPANNPGGDEHDLASLQATTPLEAHGIYGDPLFTVDPKTIDSDPTGFAPKAASPAIDHGTDAGYGYTIDFAGKPVPAGTAADIGAFERQP